MIALEHERALGPLGAAQRCRGRALDLDVFVNDLAVVDDLQEASVGGFLALAIKARGLEGDIEGLPFAGRLAGVEARLGGIVNAAAIAIVQVLVLLAEAVEDLHFILALKKDPGISHPWDVELRVP